MATIKFTKRDNWFTVFCFQLCVIANNLFGEDPQLFVLSKLVMLLFFGVVVLRILYRGKVRYNQMLLLPILFTVYCFATILWAYQPDIALSQMVTQVQLLLLMVFVFFAMNDGVTVLDYLKAVYVSGFLLAALALFRYGGISQYADAMLSGERMGGEIANLNTFGMVFGNAALSSAYYFILKKKGIHVLSFVLFSFFAFSSASRKAMLMIVIGVVAIAVLHYGWRRIYRSLLVGVAVVVALTLVLQLPYFSGISERVTNMLTGERDVSDEIRQNMIEYGLQLFEERPIFGYGISNYEAMYFRKTYSHNNYIELLVSGGIVALVMYYLILLIPAVGLLLGRKKGEKLDEMHLMLLLWTAVELVFGFALVQLYKKDSWLLMGMLIAESVRASNKKPVLQESGHEVA